MIRYVIPVSTRDQGEQGFIVHDGTGEVVGLLIGPHASTDLHAAIGPHVRLTWCLVHANAWGAWVRNMPQPWGVPGA